MFPLVVGIVESMPDVTAVGMSWPADRPLTESRMRQRVLRTISKWLVINHLEIVFYTSCPQSVRIWQSDRSNYYNISIYHGDNFTKLYHLFSILKNNLWKGLSNIDAIKLPKNRQTSNSATIIIIPHIHDIWSKTQKKKIRNIANIKP